MYLKRSWAALSSSACMYISLMLVRMASLSLRLYRKPRRCPFLALDMRSRTSRIAASSSLICRRRTTRCPRSMKMSSLRPSSHSGVSVIFIANCSLSILFRQFFSKHPLTRRFQNIVMHCWRLCLYLNPQ